MWVRRGIAHGTLQTGVLLGKRVQSHTRTEKRHAIRSNAACECADVLNRPVDKAKWIVRGTTLGARVYPRRETQGDQHGNSSTHGLLRPYANHSIERHCTPTSREGFTSTVAEVSKRYGTGAASAMCTHPNAPMLPSRCAQKH